MCNFKKHYPDTTKGKQKACRRELGSVFDYCTTHEFRRAPRIIHSITVEPKRSTIFKLRSISAAIGSHRIKVGKIKHREPLANDRASLYNCLMVNRLWCRTATPILWRNPLALIANNSEMTNRPTISAAHRKENLLRTYTACLDSQEKLAVYKLLKPFQEHPILRNSTNPFQRRPTFHYERYLETLNDTSLFNFIQWSFEKSHRRGVSTGREEIQTFKIFLKMFLTRSNNIQRLGFETLLTKNAAIFGNTLDDIIQIILKRRMNIKSISLLFKTKPQLIAGRTAVNIDSLITLIKSQRDLRDFWVECSGGEEMTKILMALRKHSNSLQTILFTNSVFPRTVAPDYFGLFPEMRELIFSQCQGVRASWFVCCKAKCQKITV
ncbi:hypothetical protein G9A89_010035 [Geosiphon pyriformis]|nr:hypothetical protein G9A89_010035 [Geosiphon pyriformis]